MSRELLVSAATESQPMGVTTVQRGTADGAALVQLSGATALPSASFTRPADTTAYASGDLVANSTTAGEVVPLSLAAARTAAGSGLIRRVRLRKTGTSVTNAVFRVHLYNALPTPSNGDNGAWLTSASASYLGAFDVTVDRAFSDGAVGTGAPLVGADIAFKLASGTSVYALVEARGAYTPVSAETFTVALDVIQD